MVNSFEYNKVTHSIVSCNLCGLKDFNIVSKKDRYNFPERSVICISCGLIYINPRMSARNYNDFYETGFYRGLVPIYIKKQNLGPSLDEIFDSEEKFGDALLLRIKSYLSKGLVIEIGSAVGGILASFQKELGSMVLGLEPSRVEAEYATLRGIPTRIGLFEDVDIESDRPGNILSIQSLNHFLDPKKFFIWAYNSLSNDGRLVLVVQNFLTLARKIGSIHGATQIDHVYMFTPLSLRNFIESAGFEILLFEDWDTDEYTKIGLSSHHMAIVARKIEVTPFTPLVISYQSYEKTRYDILKIRFYCAFIYPIKKVYRTVKKKLLKQFRRFAPNASC